MVSVLRKRDDVPAFLDAKHPTIVDAGNSPYRITPPCTNRRLCKEAHATAWQTADRERQLGATLQIRFAISAEKLLGFLETAQRRVFGQRNGHVEPDSPSTRAQTIAFPFAAKAKSSVPGRRQAVWKCAVPALLVVFAA